MKIITSLSKHTLIIIIGVLLALVLALISYSSKDFSASVLLLSERQFIEQSHRDAAYKKIDQQLEVFISPPLQDVDQLFVSILFSPSDIEISTSEITSPYLWNLVEAYRGQMLLEISSFATGNVDEGVIIVPFQGEMKDITVEFVSSDRGGENALSL
ncbi:MAG: hypothetical protein LBI53_01155 [Candidatus Peribacteria bacterium]|jgi:hypothetical protein|nr:hypothetical protein [Candidatus Peribacteria bacterium]